MDTHTQTLRDETTALNSQAKALRIELTQLYSSLPTADLRAQVAAMHAEKADIESRLTSLRSGSVKPVSKEEKTRVDAELRKVEKCVVAREKIVKEMWSVIADAVPKEELADLKEDFGVEF
jgi:hypothetical protein